MVRSIDWLNKLQHMLQVMAFCLVIATIQYAFQPERPYGPPVVYSLFIGTITWAVIDLGRHFFQSAQETGWPQGLAGAALVTGGIFAGWLLGRMIADHLCQLFGLYPSGGPRSFTDIRSDILVTVMAGIAGTFYFYSVNKSAYLQRKMTEAHQHASEARLKLLEAQLEPHMLFNTLANLRALIGADPQRAQQMLDHMIAYLRATLSASRGTTHALSLEFDRLRDYLELMAVRMGPRLSFSLELPAALATQPVPTLILQPLVENAIGHGLEPKVEGGSITVSARAEGQGLLLEVRDTGVGQADAPVQGKGFGMTQIRERLSTLYGAAASIEFDATPGQGARVLVRIPLHP